MYHLLIISHDIVYNTDFIVEYFNTHRSAFLDKLSESVCHLDPAPLLSDSLKMLYKVPPHLL